MPAPNAHPMLASNNMQMPNPNQPSMQAVNFQSGTRVGGVTNSTAPQYPLSSSISNVSNIMSPPPTHFSPSPGGPPLVSSHGKPSYYGVQDISPGSFATESHLSRLSNSMDGFMKQESVPLSTTTSLPPAMFSSTPPHLPPSYPDHKDAARSFSTLDTSQTLSGCLGSGLPTSSTSMFPFADTASMPTSGGVDKITTSYQLPPKSGKKSELISLLNDDDDEKSSSSTGNASGSAASSVVGLGEGTRNGQTTGPFLGLDTTQNCSSSNSRPGSSAALSAQDTFSHMDGQYDWHGTSAKQIVDSALQSLNNDTKSCPASENPFLSKDPFLSNEKTFLDEGPFLVSDPTEIMNAYPSRSDPFEFTEKDTAASSSVVNEEASSQKQLIKVEPSPELKLEALLTDQLREPSSFKTEFKIEDNKRKKAPSKDLKVEETKDRPGITVKISLNSKEPNSKTIVKHRVAMVSSTSGGKRGNSKRGLNSVYPSESSISSDSDDISYAPPPSYASGHKVVKGKKSHSKEHKKKSAKLADSLGLGEHPGLSKIEKKRRKEEEAMKKEQLVKKQKIYDFEPEANEVVMPPLKPTKIKIRTADLKMSISPATPTMSGASSVKSSPIAEYTVVASTTSSKTHKSSGGEKKKKSKNHHKSKSPQTSSGKLILIF